MTREMPLTPSFFPSVSGDLLSRVNLLRWIREWARSHEIDHFQILEFGVLNGESITEMIRQLRGGLEQVTGFDTFIGLPELTETDRVEQSFHPSFVQGAYAGGGCKQVRSFIKAATDIPDNSLALIPGDFRVTLPFAGLDQGLFPLVLHVDCDLYSSSMAAFEYCAEIAQDGTWLLADDYWCFRASPKRGQRRALHEVFDSHPRIEATPYCNYRGFGRAFILNSR